MRRAYAVVAALVVTLSASVVSAQSYERLANPLRMQVGGWLGVVFGARSSSSIAWPRWRSPRASEPALRLTTVTCIIGALIAV